MVQTFETPAAPVVSLDIPLGLAPIVTPEQFLALVAANRDRRLELTADGRLIVMPPTGGETGRSNAELNRQMGNWAVKNEALGVVFDSSTGFVLPNGATRSPDASWVKRERWESLSAEERKGFPPLCPDVAVEIRSQSDSLSGTQDKLQEYLENGAKFGLLIDPRRRMVEIYRPDQIVETLESPHSIEFGSVMPGFELYFKGLL